MISLTCLSFYSTLGSYGLPVFDLQGVHIENSEYDGKSPCAIYEVAVFFLVSSNP